MVMLASDRTYTRHFVRWGLPFVRNCSYLWRGVIGMSACLGVDFEISAMQTRGRRGETMTLCRNFKVPVP